MNTTHLKMVTLVYITEMEHGEQVIIITDEYMMEMFTYEIQGLQTKKQH